MEIYFDMNGMVIIAPGMLLGSLLTAFVIYAWSTERLVAKCNQTATAKKTNIVLTVKNMCFFHGLLENFLYGSLL